jgi:hypothetical protein
VCVYLFPTPESIQITFGSRVGGAALTWYDFIVIPFERQRLAEVLRHELTHLFAHRWNPWAPPLLCEGLAVWMQGTEQGRAINSQVVATLHPKEWCLRPLLDPKFFFDREKVHGCYMLAGSFTGFLIQKFGWDAYQRLYRGQWGALNFDRAFTRQFGLSLDEAVSWWHSELLNRPAEPAPQVEPPPATAQVAVDEWWVCRFPPTEVRVERIR